MLRTCTRCNQEKDLEKFVRQGKYYRYLCKECLNASSRTGIPNTGRFQKGYKSRLGKKLSEETKKKISESKKGKIAWNKGISPSIESIEKNRIAHLGKEPPNKGFRISSKRFSKKYKDWSNLVRSRDVKCVKCGSENRLHAHHIETWKNNEKLRFDINNGITLCVSCHGKLEGYQKGHRQSDESRKKMSIAKRSKKYGTASS